MNRDERRTRAPALPPTRIERRGVPALVPVDGEAGGTWLSVNAYGHALALLNRYEDTPHDPEGAYISRGLLVLELAGLDGPDNVGRALGSLPLQSYRPFTLASVAIGSAPLLFEWDGNDLNRSCVTGPGLLRASSGSDQELAEQARSVLFKEAMMGTDRLSPDQLTALHRSHLPKKGSLSICMHREEAVTVSSSLIMVSERSLSFRYVAGSPCESTSRTDVSLPILPSP